MKKVILLLALSAFLFHVTLAADYFPASITDTTSTHSNQAITVLSVQDQSGTQDTWNKYIEFNAQSTAYSGIINFNVPAQTITAITLTANFRGEPYASQGWTFELLTAANTWLKIGDTNPNTNGWGAWALFTFNVPSGTDFSNVISGGKVQIRFKALKALDASQLDFVKLSISSSASTPPPTTAPTAAPTTAPTTAPTQAPTQPPTQKPTSAPTSAPTAAPTQAPTSAPTSAPTQPPTGPTKNFNLRILVLSANLKKANGLDFVNLTFDSVGMPYDVVTVAASTNLAPYLATTGVGKYSGIVSVQKTLLSSAQQQVIINYQLYYGVKWAIIASAPSGLPGLSAGSATSVKSTLTLAPQFTQYAHPLQHDVSVDTQHSIAWSDLSAASVTPATITDSNIATPAILYNGKVAVADIKQNDGTHQLHYFITQNSDYFFSRIFSVVLLNWLSPAGVYMGHRRVTLAVQPDDLFMASFLWDVNTHKNPLSTSLTYRITADDLQSAADFVNGLKNSLPTGSHVTIEWPYNGAGTTWYTQPDLLFAKAKELQDSFFYVSHTYSHPCTFDTASYADVDTELKNNIAFTPSYLNNGMRNAFLSNNSLVNPCITGLFNGNCLKAMVDNGIKYAVGDNSVKKLIPANLYHPLHTTVAVNGYDGILIIPREAYDIDYDNSLPAELVDQFNTENKLKYTFEQIMDLQLDYAMEKKTAFRHDAFMFHQANVRFFNYNDPKTGSTHSVSLTTLWMERVIKKVQSYYDLPIVSPKFPEMAKLWSDREAMDKCGFNANLAVSNGKLVSITATSTASCEVALSGISLSGPTVRTETAGSEITSYVSMTAGVSQTLTLTTPIPL